MLSIGEFSSICKVSTKTLRYYEQIGLLCPKDVNPETGYRYYSINQLETMLLISRLKGYEFSLEEIKQLLREKDSNDQLFIHLLSQKQAMLKQQIEEYKRIIELMEKDIHVIQKGESVMDYLQKMDVSLVEVPQMCLLSIRKMVQQEDYPEAYRTYFPKLLHRIEEEGLTVVAPPMVLFHGSEFTREGLDTEFAIPVKEVVTGTRDFSPGLCIKSVLHGPYSDLPSVYTRQRQWIEKEGYVVSDALYEIYVTDPNEVTSEKELETEVYCPVRLRG